MEEPQKQQGFIDPNLPSPVDETASGVTNIKGAGLAAVEPDPLTQMEEQASPEEQGAYEDLVKRAVAMIHDFRGKASISDKILRALSNDQAPAYVTIGKQAGTIMRLLYENAKRQGVQYPGHVLETVGIDVVTELTELAREVGAVKDLPSPDSPEAQEFDKLAALEAAKYFGDYMLQTGQANPTEYQAVMKEQMEREASSGELDDWNMENMAPEQMKRGLAQIRGFGNGT